MPRITHGIRRSLALVIWALTLLLFWLLGSWNLESSRSDAENRLISQAGHMAAQLSVLLSLPAWELDQVTARAIVMAAMEDDSIYAVNVETKAQGMLEGQRRNYQWEPVPWDDEIADNTVQGMSPIKMEGKTIGKVEVFLSPRLHEEEQSLMAMREHWRLAVEMLFSTGMLIFVLWQWGDLRLLYRFWRRRRGAALRQAEAGQDDEYILGLTRPVSADAAQETDAEPEAVEPRGESPAWRINWPKSEGRDPAAVDGLSTAAAVVDAAQGRDFLVQHSTGWSITAGLFRQTFECAPELLSRLHAVGAFAALCHLGRVLEQAAPCVGAERLEAAARAMQAAVQKDEAQCALEVEACVLALEDVLRALGLES